VAVVGGKQYAACYTVRTDASTARRLVERMRGWDADTVFGMSPGTRDALFRRARDRAGLSGFTFHDARHSAATRMAQKLHILDLCKAFGWSNLNQATGYYNPTAAQIAGRL
jgi:integrase